MLMHAQLNIISDRKTLRELGMPDKHAFAIIVTQGNQRVVLSENVAAMVHGAIRGAWSRHKDEQLPT